MKRRTISFTWEDEVAQEVFREWVPFPDAQASATGVDRIEAFLNLSPPLDVLDVGCGNGRHAIEMARRGYHVVGIDVARRFLEEARSTAERLNVAVDFRQQRASELTEGDAFDFALAFWHTIGFMAQEEIRKHFGAIHAALRSGCPFLYVFQGPRVTPESASTDAEPIKSWTERNGKFILSEKSIRDGYREEYCVVIDTVAGEITEITERQKAMSYSEILGYLESAGFADVAAYKDFDKSPATAEDFSIFVCRK